MSYFGKSSAAFASYINAVAFPGTDICAKIAAAAATLSAAGGVIDATGFTGLQSCSSNPFLNFPATTATLVLNPSVTIATDVPWVLPQTGVIIDGQSAHPTSTPFSNVGAVIRASNAFGTSQAVISMGSGLGGNPSFGNKLLNLGVACVTPSGSVPVGCICIQNLWCQEGCGVRNVWMRGGSDTCLDVSTAQAQNSGPYENLTMAMDGVNNSAATCARFNTAAGTALRAAIALKHFSCGGGSNAAVQNIGITVDGSSIAIEDYHIEQVITGIEVGSLHGTHAVSIINGNCTSTAARPMTSCIDVSAINNTDLFTVIGNQSPNATFVTNAIVDNLPNGGTITANNPGEGGIGQYFRGAGNQVFTTSNQAPATIGGFSLIGVTFANLPAAANGSLEYCPDCQVTNPCVGGGTGALAKRLNGTWVCN